MPTNPKQLVADAKARMHQSVETVMRELGTMRTGRASVSMLDTIRVDYYGTPTPLNQVGNLAVTDPTLITLQPWDVSLIPAIEKAIRSSDLDLNPQNDGKLIRIPVPQLNEERRKNLVKMAHKHAEEGRVAIRNVRRDVNEHLKKLLKEHELSEDDEKHALAEVQKLTDLHTERDRRRLEEEGSRGHGSLIPCHPEGGRPPRGISGSFRWPRIPLVARPPPPTARADAPPSACSRSPPASRTASRSSSPRASRPTAAASRRVEYRLERVDTEQGRARTTIPPAEDPLRKHFRFPSGEPWQLSEQVETGLHVVTVEAQLPSPQDAEGDYYMARSPKAHPARNLVSALVDTEHDVYEYQEILRDPSSPLATARTLSRLALKSDPVFAQAFAEAFATAVEGKTAAPRIPDVRRLYRELLAEPFAREVAALAERPLYGPRERRELDLIYDRMDERQKQFAARLSTLTTGVPLDQLDEVDRIGLRHAGHGPPRAAREPGAAVTRRGAAHPPLPRHARDAAADPARQHLLHRGHRRLGVRGGGPLRPRLRDEGARLLALTL